MADEESASWITDPNIAQTRVDLFVREMESQLRMKLEECKDKITTRLMSLPCGEDEKRSDSLLLGVVGSEIEESLLLMEQCLSNNLLLLFRGDQSKGTTSAKEAPSISNSSVPITKVVVMDTSCQTDGDDDGRMKIAPEEFENYKKEVKNIIQAKVRTRELELEEKFSLRWKQLITMETSIHEKLTQSEHHATCLHAALKSAMLELGSLKEKIDEFSSTKNPAPNCSPVDLRYVQTIASDFIHLNGTSKCPNGSAEVTQTDSNHLTTPPNISSTKSLEVSQSRCSSADNISTTDSISYSKPLGCSNSKVSLFSGAHQFLLNFKYPNDSMVASYFPPTLFCIPHSSVPPTSSPSSSTTLSPTQYVLPNINPFIKLPSSNLPTSPLEVKPKHLTATNISRLLGVQKSSSPINITSSPSVISSHPSIDSFQIPKVEATDVNSPDTSEIAQRVRDILSAHNIGQRQFAREVLGLSQGTVSELLSKPKPWDKLTEKGRESYRKMLAWTQEENNFQELKTTGYKNGQACIGQPITIQPITRVDESSSSTEMRISQILMQAQAAIQNQASLSRTPKIDLKLNGDSVKMRPLVQRPTHSNRDLPIITGRSSVIECQNVNNDSLNFVTRIYREQLLELMKTAEKNKNQAEVERYRAELVRISSQSSTTSNNSINNNSIVDSTGTTNKEEVKKEPNDYECSNKTNVDGPEDLSFGRNKNSIVKEEPRSPESYNSNDGEILHNSENGSNDSTNHASSLEQTSTNEKEGSPLRQMQSITNSINSATPGNTQLPLPLSGSRVTLPPIDQDTWEKCSNLNTDDIVQRVKELLSEFCISQRLFGEYVLGLSQGSVSDLLARPKPWYMLTHKGREPFVRMKCFLDEPQSVQNLVSNQYKVPAEKLLRVTTSLTQSISEPQISSRKRKSSISISDECSQNTDQSTHYKKNRISFTDEQKKLLRQTYKKDPYPLHSTIEQLASTLEVGVKTIINWFHNHRMRDKSRFSNSWEQNNQSNDSFSHDMKFHVKSEDHSSQSCDSSSDFFLYFNNTGTEANTFVTNCEDNQDEQSKHVNAMDVDDNSEADDIDESGEPQKKEMKVSKRKSARPQKMSSHYIADKQSGSLHETSENPISSSSIDDRKMSDEKSADDSIEMEKSADDLICDFMEDGRSTT